MNEITIYTNVFTPISVNLEEYDFEGIAKLVLVIKNDYDGECIVREEFAEAGSHQILVSPEQAEKLYNGSIMGFIKITDDDKEYAEGQLYKVALKEWVGDCDNE